MPYRFCFLFALIIWTSISLSTTLAQNEVNPPLLRIGIVVGGNLNYRTIQAEPFRLYLQKRIKRPIEMVAFQDYQSLMRAHRERRIHYGVYSATAYAKSWSICRCIEPLAAPKATDGSQGMRAVLLVAHDTAYQRLEDLNGKRILYTGAHSLMGRLIPARAMALLSANGDFVFEDVDIAQNMRDSLGALQLGTAEAIFGWEGSPSVHNQNPNQKRGTVALAEQMGIIPPDFTRVIWRSELVPHGPHAVLSDMPEELKAQLRQALLALDPASPPQLMLILTGPGPASDDETSLGALPRRRFFTAHDIIDAIDLTFGGGFASIQHYDYIPVLNIIGWRHETTIPDWP